MKKICIIGSINMDLVIETDHFVKPGETISGKRFFTSPGGKGANQAVACGRLGANPAIIGKIGRDAYGEMYREVFRQNHVYDKLVQDDPDSNTGIAVIELEESGENRIVVAAGANGQIDGGYVRETLTEIIMDYDIFLLQQEIPEEANKTAVKLLSEAGKVIILDPAPVREMDDSFLEKITYITPNEHELKAITGCCDMRSGILALEGKGVGRVICKAGGDGAYLIENGVLVHVPAAEMTEPVDTTGAGDTFNGAFAYALAADYSCYEAVRFANYAAGLSITKAGAQSGMPELEAVRQFMKGGKKP